MNTPNSVSFNTLFWVSLEKADDPLLEADRLAYLCRLIRRLAKKSRRSIIDVERNEAVYWSGRPQQYEL